MPRTAGISRDPNPAASDIPEGYRGLVKPSLSDADSVQMVTGGAGLVDMIKRRDEIRTVLQNMEYDRSDRSGVDEIADREYEAHKVVERDLTQQIERGASSPST